MIMRAESWVTVSSTWPAKNTIAVSMIANSSAKNTGATSANSTAAEPGGCGETGAMDFGRMRSKQRVTTSENPQDGGDFCAEIYLKLIVEVFRQIRAERPVPLTAR